MQRSAVVVIILAAVACDDASKRSEPAPAAGSAAPVASEVVRHAAPVVPDAAVALTFRLACERLVPKYVRDKLLGGRTPYEHIGPGSVTCTFGGANTTVVAVSCANLDAAGFAHALEHGKASMKATSVRDLTDVGRIAWQGDGNYYGVRMKVVQFWDDDTPCYVDVAAKKQWNVELAKALVSTINPETIE